MPSVTSFIRTFLYFWLFVFSVILLGLTAYRISYTRGKSSPDILTTREHFYNPIIVELLVTSILAVILSSIMMIAVLAFNGGGFLSHAFEQAWLWILFIMFLVGAAIATHDFSNLRWCRGARVCRILEAIKAFSWICWAMVIFLILAGLYSMFTRRRRDRGAVGTHPETRTTSTAQPVTTPATATA